MGQKEYFSPASRESFLPCCPRAVLGWLGVRLGIGTSSVILGVSEILGVKLSLGVGRVGGGWRTGFAPGSRCEPGGMYIYASLMFPGLGRCGSGKARYWDLTFDTGCVKTPWG